LNELLGFALIHNFPFRGCARRQPATLLELTKQTNKLATLLELTQQILDVATEREFT
jgi:hypothetical protein